MDDNDVQWRWVALEDTLALCWVAGESLRPDDYELAWTQDTGVGYNLELAIPEAGLEKLGTSLGIDLSEWSKIGFDLQVTDNDSTKSNDGIRWHATGGDDYAHPAAWGTVQLGGTNDTLQIPWAYSSPEIDGYLDDDWFDNEIPEISMTAITEGNYPPDYPEGAAPDFSTFFRAAWNGDGFYLFGRVVDDSIQVENEVTDDNEWQQDCWEIYLDGENEKSGDYDKNDVYYRFVYGLDTATQGPMDGFDIAWVQTDDGYTFELGIPVATLEDTNISLHGQIIGFEVQCTDNDGNGRESITKWWSKSNDSYQNSSLFGTAILCPYIIVTSPNGGEELFENNTYNITWESAFEHGDVKIEYSTNNGNSWDEIIAATPDYGSYAWMVTHNPTYHCLVRVSRSGGKFFDISDDMFSISSSFISITSPSGGEEWKAEDIYNIKWYSLGTSGNVKIEHSIDNGLSWNKIATVPDTGSYAWQVPDTVSDSCLIMISDTDGAPSDISNSVFKILPASGVPDSGIPENYSMSIKRITADKNVEFRYSVPVESELKFGIYDITGKLIKFISKEEKPGFYSRLINMSDIPTGVYFVRMEVNGKEVTETDKFILLK